MKKALLALTFTVLTPIALFAVPICIAYDGNGHCTLWQDTGTGQVSPPAGYGGGGTGQCICTMYDDNMNCTQAICN